MDILAKQFTGGHFMGHPVHSQKLQSLTGDANGFIKGLSE